MGPPAHESGHFYFAQTGHSHFAATLSLGFRDANAMRRREAQALCANARIVGKVDFGSIHFSEEHVNQHVGGVQRVMESEFLLRSKPEE
jgi:hypothetical protein